MVTILLINRCKQYNVEILLKHLCRVFSEAANQLNTPRLSRNFQNLLEISVKVDDGLEWKDEYAMIRRVLLAKGCTVCTPDGARHG
jgi:hypothetical protein